MTSPHSGPAIPLPTVAELRGCLLVEARAVLCPVPIIRLAVACRNAQHGTVVVLLSDDLAAWHDVPAWCRLRGHTLVGADRVPQADALIQQVLDISTRAATPQREPHLPGSGADQVLVHVIRVE